MAKDHSDESSFMLKLATQIVDKRNLIFLLVVIAIVFSVFSRNWVNVENDLTSFLPDDAETKLALNVMEDQFTTYGTARFMVANVTYEDAATLRDAILQLKGVQSVDFDRTAEHYANASALFSVTFDQDETNDACIEALDRVKDTLSGYDLYVSTDLGNTLQDTIAREVNVIMIYVAIIVVVVLTLTSQTYAEVPVLALDLRHGHDFKPGQQLYARDDLVRLQLRDEHSAAGAVVGLCRHSEQPF